MTKELLVSVDSYPSGIVDDDLRRFARSLYNCTSNVDNLIKIKLKNLGSERFAGANVSQLSTSQNLGLSDLTQNALSLGKRTVPALAVGEEKEALSWLVSPSIDGVLNLQFGLESRDSDPIRLKRSEEDEPRNPTTYVITVGKYTDILILYRLQEVSAKLDELIKGRRRKKR